MLRYGRGFKADPWGHRVTRLQFHPRVRAASGELPPSVRVDSSPVQNQGETNECVAHAIACALYPVLGFVASQTVTYGIACDLGRADYGLSVPRTDDGCAPNEAARGVQTFGVMPRASNAVFDAHNSDADPRTATADPDLATLERCATHLVLGQYEIFTAQDLRVALATVQRPVTVAMTATDEVDAWTPSKPPIGPQIGAPNHYVAVVGYHLGPGGELLFDVQNSWGTWGDAGLFVATEKWADYLADQYVWDARVVPLAPDAHQARETPRESAR